MSSEKHAPPAVSLPTATDPDVVSLAAEVGGRLFWPGDPAYDEACRTYNLLTPLTPAFVVNAHAAADVQAVVRFAARRGLGVAVRGGGHSVVRPTEHAVLINLGEMKGVTVSPALRTARVVGGTLWQEVVDQVAKYDLAPLNGSSVTVGAIGFCLGGGHGPVLSRKYGYASDHVISLDVVLASGALRRVTAESDPELFSALRGSRGNLGVVTAIEIRLFPVSRFYGGGLWFPGERIADVLRVWQSWAAQLPDDFSTSLAVQRMPDQEGVPEPMRGTFLVHVRAAYLGDEEQGEALLFPLRVLGPTVLDTIRETPYREVGSVHMDPLSPLPYVDRSMGLRELTPEAMERFVELTGPDSGSPLTVVEIRALGGALDRAPTAPDSVPSRGLPYQLFALGLATPDRTGSMREAADAVVEGMRRWKQNSGMVNFLTPEEATTPEGVQDAYGAERYARLLSIKQAYDPANLFRVNHNIQPTDAPDTVTM
ncbi:FAD-binding oxidoreductase [Streptomyces sp. NPDC059785]|uniref:FAD-binding oxidoreductase n=1 Tax=unclassified Streptomyces TaxID=2593676 RepID=UPI003659D334